MAVIAVTRLSARIEGGLASAFLSDRAGTIQLIVSGVVSVVLAGIWKVSAGLMSALAGAIGAAGVVMLAPRQLGGFTGDVLGAAGDIAETASLLAAAAKC